MKTIYLLSCCDKKEKEKMIAVKLYCSTWFRYCLEFSKKQKPDLVFILSAKYGLVGLDDVIEPYNEALNKKNTQYRKQWAQLVIEQLKTKTDLENDKFYILAGKSYYQYILPAIKHAELPFKHLTIGRQMSFMKNNFPA